MNNKKSIAISLFIHILFLVFLVLIKPKETAKNNDIKINIELITKKNKKTVEKKDIIPTNVDIIKNHKIIEANITPPVKTDFATDFIDKTPEILLMDKTLLSNNDVKPLTPNVASFEMALNNLQPDLYMEDETDSDINIEWDGNSRNIVTNGYIDFSSFPKESFTGVGVQVEFMVNTNGETFDVNIKPPGSGSFEFDILIKKYVTEFVFNKGETKSRGEILIVYKK